MANCRGRTVAERFVDGSLHGSSIVQKMPYIGPYFAQLFHERGLHYVRDIVRSFTTNPSLTAREIEQRLGVMFANPNRGQCLTGYHVAAVNICGFNSVVKLLRFAHDNREEWEALGFIEEPEIPNANRVPLRHRGSNVGARVCARPKIRQIA